MDLVSLVNNSKLLGNKANPFIIFDKNLKLIDELKRVEVHNPHTIKYDESISNRTHSSLPKLKINTHYEPKKVIIDNEQNNNAKQSVFNQPDEDKDDEIKLKPKNYSQLASKELQYKQEEEANNYTNINVIPNYRTLSCLTLFIRKIKKIKNSNQIFSIILKKSITHRI